MVRRKQLNSGKVVKVVVREGVNKGRKAICKCCGEEVKSGEGCKVIFPENKYIICNTCIEEAKPMKPIHKDKATKVASNNTRPHRVVTSVDDYNADRLWLEAYGFTKYNGYHCNVYENSQSIGSLINNLFKIGVIKVGLIKQPLQVVRSVSDYDDFAKTIKMRGKC